MEQVTGTVKAKRKDGKGIMIDESWYSSRGQVPCNKGDEVKVSYEVNGRWNNISNVEVLSKGTAPAPSGGGKAFNNAGIEIGHAINNAVQLAIFEGRTDMDTIREKAIEVFYLAKEMRDNANDLNSLRKKRQQQESEEVPEDNDIPF